MEVQIIYSEILSLKENNMRRFKMLLIFFILVGVLVNFKLQFHALQTPTEIKPISQVQKYNETQNIPLPTEIKNQMIEKEKQRKIQENLRLEEERIQQEKLKKEERKKEEVKITSRSGSLIQNNTQREGWIKFIATAYCNCSKCRRRRKNCNGNYPSSQQNCSHAQNFCFRYKSRNTKYGNLYGRR